MRKEQSGIALIMVIFIIVGLTVIAAPLAYIMITQEQESSRLIENSRSSVSVYGARNHAISFLSSKAAERDGSKYSDIKDEYLLLDLGGTVPPSTIPFSDIRETISAFNLGLDENVSWGASSVDAQSKINLNTLTPLMCENLIGRRLASLYNYRKNGDEGVYRLFRSIYEPRKLGLTESEMDNIANHATVWSGPNIYGSYFSSDIPAYVDDNGLVNTIGTNIGNKIAPGLLLRVETDGSVYFTRISSIQFGNNTYSVTTDKVFEPAENCMIRIEIPRPVNINTASAEVMRALFSGIALANNPELTDEEVNTLIENIIEARAEMPNRGIEGYNEMARIITATFQEESLQASALLKAISWPSYNLYKLENYTAPLCYTSDDIFEISAFSTFGSNTYGEKARDDLFSVASVVPVGENLWSFESQFDWQNLLNSGFGNNHISGPRTCFVVPPEGSIIDINPQKESEEGYVTLETERVIRDKTITTFIAHFDSGDEESVFDADYGTAGSEKATVDNLELTEDHLETALDANGVNFRDGGNISYSCEDNIDWQTNESQLVMMQPVEIEFWVTLPNNWSSATKCTFMEFGSEVEFENRVTLNWNPDFMGGALDLAVCDAGLDQNAAHYQVPLPDENEYVAWEAGGSYHIRAVIYKSHKNYMTILVDGKKLAGYFTDESGKFLPDGYTSRITNYTYHRPPITYGGVENTITVTGSLLNGSATIYDTLHKQRVNYEDNGDMGFTAFATVYDLEPGISASISTTETNITVDSIEGFPQKGILCWKGSNTQYEFILYSGLTESPHPTFTGCKRGHIIGFDDGQSCASKAMIIPARNDVDARAVPESRLTLISITASDVQAYPDAGGFYLESNSFEVISYMGKNTSSGLGSPAFFLNPFQNYGRQGMGTTQNAGTVAIQLFCHQIRLEKELEDKGKEIDTKITVIKNDQTKEHVTVHFVSGQWMALEASVSAKYETGNSNYSRIMKFPSSELPTVRPDNFYIGANKYADDEFYGSIDEIKIIKKTEGTRGTVDYQPKDIWYGRKSYKGNDSHLILTNIHKGIDDENTGKMSGQCYGLVENPDEDSQWNEAVFIGPCEDSIDPNSVTPVQVKLHDGTNNFSTTIPVSSTAAFPEQGYILVSGNYLSSRTDPYTGKPVYVSQTYKAVFYYETSGGDSFGGLEILEAQYEYDDLGTNTSINIGSGQSGNSSIMCALISTEVEFAKRAGLWTKKPEIDSLDSTKFAFPEGWRIMCLRYPYGAILEEALDTDPEEKQVVFNAVTKTFEIEKYRMHFELGTVEGNDLEIIAAYKDLEEEDEFRFSTEFRGCFGTTKSYHDEKSVATLIPVRYMDMSAKLSDSQYLRYFPLQSSRPGMRITGIEWTEEENPPEETQIRILMRVDNSCDWDSEPGETNDTLREWISPCTDKLEIRSQDESTSFEYFPGNFVEFRIFFEWKYEAYLSDDWKKCIKLEKFKLYYKRPTQILESRKSVY